jgi:hypothetical protein
VYCHMPYSFVPCLLAQEGSGAATCSAALDSVSLPGRALMLSHAPQL